MAEMARLENYYLNYFGFVFLDKETASSPVQQESRTLFTVTMLSFKIRGKIAVGFLFPKQTLGKKE